MNPSAGVKSNLMAASNLFDLNRCNRGFLNAVCKTSCTTSHDAFSVISEPKSELSGSFGKCLTNLDFATLRFQCWVHSYYGLLTAPRPCATPLLRLFLATDGLGVWYSWVFVFWMVPRESSSWLICGFRILGLHGNVRSLDPPRLAGRFLSLNSVPPLSCLFLDHLGLSSVGCLRSFGTGVRGN